MRAAVECAICGQKLFFDTRIPISPESAGWIEIPPCGVSAKAYMEGRNAYEPVCPRCLETHTMITRIFNPFFSERGEHP